jgi:hypothetical protein
MLLLVLKVGNVLNFGKDATSPVNYASGFSLSSLVKLSQTKAFVGQTTLLQFLVETVDVGKAVKLYLGSSFFL